jgi:hypothetical protein
MPEAAFSQMNPSYAAVSLKLRQRERQLVEFNVQCEAAAAKVPQRTAEKLGGFRDRSEFQIGGLKQD